MIYLRKPSYYWLNHLICSTMVTELSCPFPAHITFYFAVPYLTIICHNNKLHVLHCLQSLPLVLSKNHESHILFSALIQQSCKKKNKKKFLQEKIHSVSGFLHFTRILQHTNLWCIPPPHGSCPYLQNPSGFDHRKQESGAKSLSTFQLSAVWVIFPHRKISPLAERPLLFPRHV